MSYYNKHESNALLVANNSEKELFQALASAELNTRSVTAEERIRDLESRLTPGKKHSSATLLRRKLKGHLVREFHEI